MNRKNSVEETMQIPLNAQKYLPEFKKLSLEEEQKKDEIKEGFMSSSTDFKRIEIIGQGSSGIVEKAIYMPKNQVVALKVRIKFCLF